MTESKSKKTAPKEFDVQAFEDVVNRYSKQLYSYCLKKLSNDHCLAEETVSDVMRILYIKWDTLAVGDNFPVYLYRVANNCIMQAKERNRKYYYHNRSYEDALNEGILTDPVHCDEYFHGIDSEDRFIEMIIDDLPEEYKSLFKYRFLEKKTIVQIVNITGIPYSSLRMRFSKIESFVRREISRSY